MLSAGSFVPMLGASLAAVLLFGAPAVRAQATDTLTASDGAGGDKFGQSVSLDGDAAIIGASGANIGLAADGGAAYVRRWDGSSWESEQKLTLVDPVSLDAYGSQVGLRGDLCVVGVPGRKLLLKNSAGAIAIYRRIDGVWTWRQTLTAVDAASFDVFGGRFALTQDRIVVGVAAKDVALKSQQGEVYVYRFDGSSFVLEQQLFASDGLAGDRFGASVDIDGDVIVVGAPEEDSNGATDNGAVYVFRRVAGAWVERQKLLPSGGMSLDSFGTSVAVDGPVIVAGAPDAGPFGNLGRGTAWVYRDHGTSFVQEQTLLAGDGLPGDAFGTSVEVDGNVIVVGAPRDDVGTSGIDVGSAWLFRFGNGSWAGEQLAAPAEIGPAGQFGATLGLDGALMLVGAPNNKVGSFAVQGATCVVKTQPAAWTWVGSAFAGALGAPDLVGSGALATGSGFSLQIDDAQPQSDLAVCISLVQIKLPFKGGVLVPAPDLVLLGLLTDASGALALQGFWPGGVPSGFPITYQAWVQDRAAPHGYSATNAITSKVP